MSLTTSATRWRKPSSATRTCWLSSAATTNTEYTVDTSEQSVETVKKVVSDEFGDKLKKYTFEYTDLKPIKEGDFTGIEAKLHINADPSYKDESGVAPRRAARSNRRSSW